MAQQFFEENVQFRAPKGFLAAMATLARREYCASVSDLIRRCLIARLREEGIPIEPANHDGAGKETAGELHERPEAAE